MLLISANDVLIYVIELQQMGHSASSFSDFVIRLHEGNSQSLAADQYGSTEERKASSPAITHSSIPSKTLRIHRGI